MASSCKTCAEPYTVADMIEVEFPSELSALDGLLISWRFRSNVRHRETVRVVATTECTDGIKLFACPLCLKAKSGCGLTVARLPCRAISFLKPLDLRKLILKVLESRLCFLQGRQGSTRIYNKPQPCRKSTLKHLDPKHVLHSKNTRTTKLTKQ